MADLTVLILAQNEEKNIVRSICSVKKLQKEFLLWIVVVQIGQLN